MLVDSAHAEDPDVNAGGLAAQRAARDREVCFVSLTNGNAGHHEMAGAELARHRQRGATAAGVISIDPESIDIDDGELRPTLANMRAVIRLLRANDPDLLLTHRRTDYYPDHRYTA